VTQTAVVSAAATVREAMVEMAEATLEVVEAAA
jgi:hypothetical protein